jgi:hypothetical protein
MTIIKKKKKKKEKREHLDSSTEDLKEDHIDVIKINNKNKWIKIMDEGGGG